MTEFNWKEPDYAAVMRERQERLTRLRRDPGLLQGIKDYYRDDHYVEFINDWGMTRDPRLASEGRSTVIPFILFPRQEELLHFFHYLMKNRLRGNVDKVRDCGASWCALTYSLWQFLFFENIDIGFGSRKEELVDDKNDPKALFPKARMFIQYLPKEFQPKDWEERRHAPFLKLLNPETGSTIVGEAGDNIGRGGRTLMYFVDEHAFIERPLLAEAALSENTNTQINISTHNSTGSLFYKQCQILPKDRLFEFDWTDDPRKDQEWYDTKKSDPATDPIIFAREVDRDPSASIADGFIDAALFDDAMKRGPAEVVGSGPWIYSIDCGGLGPDESVVNIRRGAINFPQLVFPKTDGSQLAAIVERDIDKRLSLGLAPLGAVIYELEGPGYEFHATFKTGRYAAAARPMHPGAKLKAHEFFNIRARFWALAKEWLEEGGKSMQYDLKLKTQGSSIRYDYKIGARGERRLILEDKKQYRGRLAADPRNKQAGPSPDRADAWAMGFHPCKMENIRQPQQLQDDRFFQPSPVWKPLDSVIGY